MTTVIATIKVSTKYDYTNNALYKHLTTLLEYGKQYALNDPRADPRVAEMMKDITVSEPE